MPKKLTNIGVKSRESRRQKAIRKKRTDEQKKLYNEKSRIRAALARSQETAENRKIRLTHNKAVQRKRREAKQQKQKLERLNTHLKAIKKNHEINEDNNIENNTTDDYVLDLEDLMFPQFVLALVMGKYCSQFPRFVKLAPGILKAGRTNAAGESDIWESRDEILKAMQEFWAGVEIDTEAWVDDIMRAEKDEIAQGYDNMDTFSYYDSDTKENGGGSVPLLDIKKDPCVKGSKKNSSLRVPKIEPANSE